MSSLTPETNYCTIFTLIHTPMSTAIRKPRRCKVIEPVFEIKRKSITSVPLNIILISQMAPRNSALAAQMRKQRENREKQPAAAVDNPSTSQVAAEENVVDVPVKTVRPPKKVGMFSDINKETISMSKSVSVWKDSEFESLNIYKIEPLNTDECVLQGAQLFSDINSDQITADTLLKLLSLAVSIRSTGNIKEHLMKSPMEVVKSDRVYTRPEAEAVIEPTVVNDEEQQEVLELFADQASQPKSKKQQKRAKKVSAKLMEINQGASTSATIVGKIANKEYQAAAYAYMAAYLMRLQCRQSDKVMSGLEVPKNRFSGFYDAGASTLDTLVPGEKSFENLRTILGRKPEVTSTWVAWVAYNENERKSMLKQDLGLLEYLAIQVFAYQGMHVVTQVFAIHQIAKCGLGDLLQQLNSKWTTTAVNVIYNIIKNYQRTDKHPERKTYWRYARVWNDGYFSQIQSKSCSQLLYLAAKTVKTMSNDEKSDPTQIFAIKDMATKMKERLDLISDKLVDMLMAVDDNDETTGDIWK
ncbi:putative nucleocapsid [Hyptis latent virus]|uniref:Nucleoprotein n=1 Tax=Hyptis latent virus TaxID=2963947 RepID=A0AAE9MPU8_9RHAB|nr:putative nucleocapsid [Hyptis latent virus]